MEAAVGAALGVGLALVVGVAQAQTPGNAAEQGPTIATPAPPPPASPVAPPENAGAAMAPIPEPAPAPKPRPKPLAEPQNSADALPPPPPPGPPPPTRSPTAVLRVLDKVTAETLMFEAPVGRRVRYKTLIFTVKACETRDADAPQPRNSAYVIIQSQPEPLPDRAPPPAKEIYRGWMFASAPGLHPFEHPVYDAWLETCSAVRGPS